MSTDRSITNLRAEESSLKLTTGDVDSLGTPSRTFRARGASFDQQLHSTLMSRIDAIGSGFPLRLAQAYEPQRAAAPARLSANQVFPSQVSPDQARLDTTNVDQVRTVQSLSEVTTARSTQRPEGINKLVAARVNVPISFPSDELTARPRAAAGSPLSLYAVPADRNTAATAVNVGRSLDVTA
jgi:hypothetical protein